MPKPDHVDRLNALREGMKWANQNGITRVHSAGGEFDQLDLLQELREEKQLSVRFHIAYSLTSPRNFGPRIWMPLKPPGKSSMTTGSM